MPIGLTPGFLSRAMRRQAMRYRVHLGSMRVEHRCLAVRARDWQRAFAADLNDVHSLLHM